MPSTSTEALRICESICVPELQEMSKAPKHTTYPGLLYRLYILLTPTYLLLQLYLQTPPLPVQKFVFFQNSTPKRQSRPRYQQLRMDMEETGYGGGGSQPGGRAFFGGCSYMPEAEPSDYSVCTQDLVDSDTVDLSISALVTLDPELLDDGVAVAVCRINLRVDTMTCRSHADWSSQATTSPGREASLPSSSRSRSGLGAAFCATAAAHSAAPCGGGRPSSPPLVSPLRLTSPYCSHRDPAREMAFSNDLVSHMVTIPEDHSAREPAPLTPAHLRHHSLSRASRAPQHRERGSRHNLSIGEAERLACALVDPHSTSEGGPSGAALAASLPTVSEGEGEDEGRLQEGEAEELGCGLSISARSELSALSNASTCTSSELWLARCRTDEAALCGARARHYASGSNVLEHSPPKERFDPAQGCPDLTPGASYTCGSRGGAAVRFPTPRPEESLASRMAQQRRQRMALRSAQRAQCRHRERRPSEEGWMGAADAPASDAVHGMLLPTVCEGLSDRSMDLGEMGAGGHLGRWMQPPPMGEEAYGEEAYGEEGEVGSLVGEPPESPSALEGLTAALAAPAAALTTATVALAAAPVALATATVALGAQPIALALAASPAAGPGAVATQAALGDIPAAERTSTVDDVSVVGEPPSQRTPIASEPPSEPPSLSSTLAHPDLEPIMEELRSSLAAGAPPAGASASTPPDTPPAAAAADAPAGFANAPLPLPTPPPEDASQCAAPQGAAPAASSGGVATPRLAAAAMPSTEGEGGGGQHVKPTAEGLLQAAPQLGAAAAAPSTAVAGLRSPLAPPPPCDIELPRVTQEEVAPREPMPSGLDALSLGVAAMASGIADVFARAAPSPSVDVGDRASTKD